MQMGDVQVMSSVGLLTLDRASILLPVEPPYPNVATINKNDNEIIKSIKLGEEWVGQSFGHSRRHQLDLEPFIEPNSNHWPTNIADLSDKQAFSFKQNGETTPFVDVEDSPRTLEMEPLDRGGILVDGTEQLPFGVYTKQATSYRIRKLLHDERDGAVLEYRRDNRSEWEEIEFAGTYEVSYLVHELAEQANLISLERPTASDIEEAIEQHYGSSQKTAKSQTEEMVATIAAIATDTAFDQGIPIPAPLFSDNPYQKPDS